LAEPRYRDHIPILIGGSGEKKTFSIAARYADHLNVIAGFDELPGKLDALAKRCDEAGRDRATLETSVLLTVVLDENASPDLIPAEMSQRMVVGGADHVAEQVKTKVLDAGIDGVIINMPLYTPGVITAAAEALRPLVGL
jgi:alkanesulfonate monooxygenase SsuD/methylene tetrahydromethanopterin reductase-like flavin-dependent oxidoreductase (luciferase family)